MSDIDAGVTTPPPRGITTNNTLTTLQVSSQSSTDSHLTSHHPNESTGGSFKEAVAEKPNSNATKPITLENSSSSADVSALGFSLPVTSALGLSLPIKAATESDMPPLVSVASLAPSLQQVASALPSMAPNLKSVLFPPVIMSTGITGDSSLSSAKRPTADQRDKGKAAQNVNTQSKPALNTQISNNASELSTQLETKVHGELNANVPVRQTPFPAGVLASQALALARTASNGVHPSKVASSDSGNDLEQDQKDRVPVVCKEQKSSNTTVPSIYSPQMVQAGKSTTIPLRTPGFPFVNPFLPASTKSEGDPTPTLTNTTDKSTVGAKTTSVSRPPENATNANVMPPGYVMMALPIIMPPNLVSTPQTPFSPPVLPNYSLAMENAFASILMTSAGTQIPQLVSSLAALNQTPKGVVANLNDITDTSNTQNDIEPGEIHSMSKSVNIEENRSQLGNDQQAMNSQLHMFDVAPMGLKVQPESISIVSTKKDTFDSKTNALSSGPDEALPRRADNDTREKKQDSDILLNTKTGSFAVSQQPKISSGLQALKNKLALKMERAELLKSASSIPSINDNDSATRSKNANNNPTEHPAKGTNKRKQSCPSRSLSKREEDQLGLTEGTDSIFEGLELVDPQSKLCDGRSELSLWRSAVLHFWLIKQSVCIYNY